ncbi:MAG: hypothetical protein IPQ16_00030 [Geobacteraceae bacterium]|nr:hypothetical protein [Geobacteraceae bacterium]
MILGFNHNVVYKGEVFHVQTEDSGISNPHIITLLYRGGVILCSKKTSYADILRMDNFESVVEELMKAQHKEMMRRLKSGEFDDRAFSIEATLIENYEIQSPEPEAEEAPSGIRIDDIFSSSPSAPKSSSKSDLSMLFELPVQKAAPVVPATPPSVEKPVKQAVNLDDAILNFFGATGKK